jgi:hypothetical protein
VPGRATRLPPPAVWARAGGLRRRCTRGRRRPQGGHGGGCAARGRQPDGRRKHKRGSALVRVEAHAQQSCNRSDKPLPRPHARCLPLEELAQGAGGHAAARGLKQSVHRLLQRLRPGLAWRGSRRRCRANTAAAARSCGHGRGGLRREDRRPKGRRKHKRVFALVGVEAHPRQRSHSRQDLRPRGRRKGASTRGGWPGWRRPCCRPRPPAVGAPTAPASRARVGGAAARLAPGGGLGLGAHHGRGRRRLRTRGGRLHGRGRRRQSLRHGRPGGRRRRAAGAAGRGRPRRLRLPGRPPTSAGGGDGAAGGCAPGAGRRPRPRPRPAPPPAGPRRRRRLCAGQAADGPAAARRAIRN